MAPMSDPLTTLWAITVIAALVIGLIFGLLTYLQTKGSWPAALLAALTAAGGTILGVHQVLISGVR